jgi:hypothetical protein
VKSLFVVSPVSGSAEPIRERRKHQRRMGIPRRIADRRAVSGRADDASSERRVSSNRRAPGSRRKRPDRRIGLSPDLDLYLIGI